MNAEQKQRVAHELGQWNAAMKSSCSVSDLLAISTRMTALMQDLMDALEPEPVGYTNETELDYVRTYEALPVSGAFWPTSDEADIALYTAPPTPSVPDEQLQAAFDRGLKAGNEQAIAQQIEIHKLHDLLAVQQPEQPAPPALSDERIDQLCDAVERECVIFSQSGIYALARAIEREILGGGE